MSYFTPASNPNNPNSHNSCELLNMIGKVSNYHIDEDCMHNEYLYNQKSSNICFCNKDIRYIGYLLLDNINCKFPRKKIFNIIINIFHAVFSKITNRNYIFLDKESCVEWENYHNFPIFIDKNEININYKLITRLELYSKNVLRYTFIMNNDKTLSENIISELIIPDIGDEITDYFSKSYNFNKLDNLKLIIQDETDFGYITTFVKNMVHKRIYTQLYNK